MGPWIVDLIMGVGFVGVVGLDILLCWLGVGVGGVLFGVAVWCLDVKADEDGDDEGRDPAGWSRFIYA